MAEHISLGDILYFGVTVHNPSGGALINADATPRWLAYKNTSDTPVLQGLFDSRTNIIGTYKSSFPVSSASGFTTGDYVEVHASGMVNTIQGRAIVKSFVIDDLYKVNLIQVSGNQVHLNDFQTSATTIENAVWDANLNNHTSANTTGSGLREISKDVFFANVKLVQDSTVPQNEYTCNWFKNGDILGSGQVTNPALSVFKTTDGSTLFSNGKFSYANVGLGVLRYNEGVNIVVSGEPYLVKVSGLIEGANRVWTNIVGLDYL